MSDIAQPISDKVDFKAMCIFRQRYLKSFKKKFNKKTKS